MIWRHPRPCRDGTIEHSIRSQSSLGTRCGFRISLCLMVISMWQASSALALEIREIRWGFNGKVALNRFNMLSVLVDNPLPQPFEGTLVLRKSLGGVGYIDAELVEPIALAPNATKWVQFYPYVNSSWGNSIGNESWYVSVGHGERKEIPTPHVAKYQRVILDDPSRAGANVLAFRHMPENLFPAFVSATDALQVLALDREPRTWIPAQKEALLDWLHLGGTLLIMAGPTGKAPDFTGPLAVLNSPLDDRRIGAGRILKTARKRGELGEEEVRRMFADLPKNVLSRQQAANIVQDPRDPQDPIDYVDPATLNQASAANLNNNDTGDPFVSSSFLSQLKEMTKPEHNWILLHLMFWVYIGMVFPGCYLLGKRWSDFRVVYGALLSTVALFSFLFSVVGAAAGMWRKRRPFIPWRSPGLFPRGLWMSLAGPTCSSRTEPSIPSSTTAAAHCIQPAAKRSR